MNLSTPLLENFLNEVEDKATFLALYLVNGVRLEGHVVDFDDNALILEGGQNHLKQQLVYLHGVATLQEAKPKTLTYIQRKKLIQALQTDLAEP